MIKSDGNNKLSVCIITKNEEKNIARCLVSVQELAAEIIVVDSGSTDKTIEICSRFGCKVYKTEWFGFGKTKKLAVDYASNDWIFVIDADEVVTEELKNRISNILKKPSFGAYRVKRMSFYLGKLIKHCGWNKDYTLRLFNKKFGNFNDKMVHESVVVSCKIAKIHEYMLHYTYNNLSDYLVKMDNYSHLFALKDKKSSLQGSLFHGVFKFINMYFLNFGFLDGRMGLVLSINSAFSVYMKHLRSSLCSFKKK